MTTASQSMPVRRDVRVLPDVPGLCCLFSFLWFVAVRGGTALSCADTLWHVRAGQEMLARGQILTADVFSHTAQGAPWQAHEWLAEVIMAALHHAFGLPGVGVFYLLIAALSLWLLARVVAARGVDDWVTLVSVGAALALADTHLLARPHLFSWLFGVATLGLLCRGGKRLLWLPAMTALWANLHGGFILGLVLQGVFLVGAVLDRWPQAPRPRTRWALAEFRVPAAALGLSVLASGLNPNGYRILLFFWHATKPVFAAGIAEWAPPNLQELWYVRFYLVALLLLFLVVRLRVSWADRLLTVVFVNGALAHVRNVSLMGIFLAPFLAVTLQSGADPILGRWRRRTAAQGRQISLSPVSGPAVTLALAAVLLGGLASGHSMVARVSADLFPLPKKFSGAAVEFLRAGFPQGRLFNEYSLGGYLLYALDPPPKVFIDGRADVYGEDIFLDYQKVAKLKEDPEPILARYGVDWLFFTAKSPLTLYLKATGRWAAVYEDEQVAILVNAAGDRGSRR